MNKSKLIQNEQIVRNRNRVIGTALKKYFGHSKEITETPLEFICECSDINCRETVKITISEYERLHKRDNRFVIVKGHKSPSVDRTVADKGSLELVEKPELAA